VVGVHVGLDNDELEGAGYVNGTFVIKGKDPLTNECVLLCVRVCVCACACACVCGRAPATSTAPS
jgi:hypothetical protein